MSKTKKINICVIGLGYVGLPLAHSLSKHFNVIGYDIDIERLEELKDGFDRTLEIEKDDLLNAHIEYRNSLEKNNKIDVFIITVPTPISNDLTPDLSFLESASESVGKVLQKNSIVIYESTVYPAATEEFCLPILEKFSSLKCGKDFFIGYSPERINPGDKKNTLNSVVKVISAQNEETLEKMNFIYSKVTKAGVYKAQSIKVAEAAKVIENTQRDINIAFVNELSMIFEKMGINTKDVLETASTKWNFLKFYPGLVGGHCIGVDPYYLTHKAQILGYKAKVILCGRETNDNMGHYIAQKTLNTLISKKKNFSKIKIGIFGLTFKENCPDVRNSKVKDIYDFFEKIGVEVLIHDPLADNESIQKEYKKEIKNISKIEELDAAILCVSHNFYKELGDDFFVGLLKTKKGIFFDVKSLFDEKQFQSNDVSYLSL